MKFLKKRLPALLLVLIIAVMPVFLAVPAQASVLDSVGPYNYFSFDDLTVILPDSAVSGCVFIYFPSIGSDLAYFACVFSTDKVFYSVVSSDNPEYFLFRPSVSSAYNVVFVPFGSNVVDFRSSIPAVLDENLFCGPSVFTFGTALNLAEYPPGFERIPVSLFAVHSVGLFSVFSGVGSWFAGAVNNLTSMFWTAEGGLTVLGVLAVASLAIAFIILLIYLLAGWLKFK